MVSKGLPCLPEHAAEDMHRSWREDTHTHTLAHRFPHSEHVMPALMLLSIATRCVFITMHITSLVYRHGSNTLVCCYVRQFCHHAH